MAGLLDDGGDGGGDLSPDVLALMATTADPSGGGDAGVPAPALPDATPAPAPADDGSGGGGSFWDRLSRGIGQAGMVLGGGDPGLYPLTPEQQRTVGLRSLLNFSLSMLANSGPSYTRRNFGQILAAGLGSAADTPVSYENMLAQRAAQGTELALKKGQLDVQRMTAAAKLLQMRQSLATLQGGQQAARDALTRIGGGSGAPSLAGGGGGGDSSAPSLTPYVAPDLPEGVTPAEDQLVRTVYGEAGSEPLAGQQAVTAVVKNRMAAGNQSAQDVIFSPNQFEPWNNADTRKKLEALDPRSDTYQQILTKAVRPVMAGDVTDPTGGATHFLNPKLQTDLGRQIPAWATGTPTATIGGHQFFSPGYGPRVQVAGPYTPPGGGGSGTPIGTLGLVLKPDGTAGTPGAGGLAAAGGAGGAGAPGGPAAVPPAPGASGGPAGVAAPDTPEIAKARADARATAQQQLAALAAQPRPDSAQEVTRIETELANRNAELDKEARGIQTKIAEEQRAEAQRNREADYKFQLDQRSADLQQKRDLEKTAAGVQTSADTEQLKKMGDASATARMVGNNLSQLRAVLPDLPESGLLFQHFPELAGYLVNSGVLSPDATKTVTATQLLQGMTANLATQLRPAGTGRLTNIEMENFQRSLPQLSETPAGRQNALAFLQRTAQRINQEYDYAQAYRKAHGDLIGMNDAIDKPRDQGGLGPMIPTAPPLNAGAAAHTAYRNSVDPGMPYYGWVRDPKSGQFSQQLMVR